MGRDFGPDLTHVGARMDRAAILQSILSPSAIITEGFATSIVTLQDGSVQTGFVIERSDAELAIKLATGQSMRIPSTSIASEKPIPVSLMPEGLLQGFTAQEAADMLAFLEGLK